MPESPLKLAVLLSGSGRSLQNLIDRIDTGTLDAEIVQVIASNEQAGGLRRAEAAGLPGYAVVRRDYATAEDYAERVFSLIRESRADLVCLAGFLSLLAIPSDFAQRVLNIHPALLPAFGGPGMYGQRVHKAVLEHGCKVSGCTVHLADQSYDTGPILVQRCCEVKEDDTAETLAARVFEQECEAYPQAIGLIAENRVTVEGRRARIASA